MTAPQGFAVYRPKFIKVNCGNEPDYRLSIEYPTIRPEHTSLIAHRYSFPSAVTCSVISVSRT